MNQKNQQTPAPLTDSHAHEADQDGLKPFEPPKIEAKGRLTIQAGSMNLWQTGP